MENPLPKRTLRVADFEMALVDSGATAATADPPVLLLVHGFPLDGAMWSEQIEPLSAISRVIVPDLRGFGSSTSGSSTSGDQTMSMELLADDLAALLDELQIDKPVVFCGLSMGGYVAWQFARKYRARLQGLILCDTKPAGDSEEAAAGREKMAQEVMQKGTGFVADAMLPKLFAPAAIEQDTPGVRRIRQTILRTEPATVAAAQRAMAARPDVTAELPGIDVPALVVVGESDAIISPAEMRKIADALPRATFVEIEGAGHMAPLENPAIFNRAVRDFLATLV